MHRLLVCGGRDFADEASFAYCIYWFEVLYGPISMIIEGRAKGADTIARKWSNIFLEQDSEGYPADWEGLGKAAGPIRNQQMLDEGKPDYVLAMPGGKGTQDMIERAVKAGIKVLTIRDFPTKQYLEMVRDGRVANMGVAAGIEAETQTDKIP